MRRLLALCSLLLSFNTSSALAGGTSTTIEANVFGLNCSLCSDEMKVTLKGLVGATDIEPRLECGKIYFEMPADAKFNDRALPSAMLAKGFTYEGFKQSKRTIAEVRKTPAEAC